MNIGIVGLGLIGGSIGLKLQQLNHVVYGVVNNEINRQKALERKLANFVSCDLYQIEKCSLIILALPIKDLINPSEELIKAIPKDCVLTDVGSIKEPIINTWEKLHPFFIGSHPMAGTECKGVNAGNKELLNNAKWVITPSNRSNEKSITTLSKLINSMGCEVCYASPNDHDQAVSLISHLPIFLSSCLIETASMGNNQSLLSLCQKLASSGFADTSRVGASNPELGLDIAINNNIYLLKALKKFKENINFTEKLIINKNWDLLLKKLNTNKYSRAHFFD